MPISAPIEVRKLVLDSGQCPFDDWFNGLEEEDQFMVDNRLSRVRLGSFGETNSVGGGVFELKFRKGRALRLYYGQVGRQIVLLIVGGDKRTQKKDIQKAKELWESYKRKGTSI